MRETLILKATGAELAASVTMREYNRLLQMPRDRELEGDLKDRADAAREWYITHGQPYVVARRIAIEDNTGEDHVRVSGNVVLRSLILARRLRAGEAHALMVVAVSAGAEVGSEIATMWSEGRPDEAFFLDRFAVAVTERLLFWTSATLCRMSEPGHETLLPHLSPGCGNWDLTDQHHLWRYLAGSSETLGPLRILESGAMHPQHTVMAAMGVTRHQVTGSPEQLCRACDLSPCAFRRAPFSGDPIRPMIALEKS